MSHNVHYLPIPWPLPEEEPAVLDEPETSIDEQIAALEAELASAPGYEAAITLGNSAEEAAEAGARALMAAVEIICAKGAIE